MQNEERINGLENQVRTLKRIACLMCCITSLLLSSGCINAIHQKNPFAKFYEGDVYPKTKVVRIVENPAISSVLIGKTSFVSPGKYDADDVIEAAQVLGADFVIWDKKFSHDSEESGYRKEIDNLQSTSNLRGNTSSESSGTIVNRASTRFSGTSNSDSEVVTYVPYQSTWHWYSHRVRFYRSKLIMQNDAGHIILPIGIKYASPTVYPPALD